jgi:hypothetical protein
LGKATPSSLRSKLCLEDDRLEQASISGRTISGSPGLMMALRPGAPDRHSLTVPDEGLSAAEDCRSEAFFSAAQLEPAAEAGAWVWPGMYDVSGGYLGFY